jgi:hypothetical protein
MNEPRPRTHADSARGLSRRRRAKRAFVANYIHELSGRHEDRRSQNRKPAKQLTEQPQGG